MTRVCHLTSVHAPQDVRIFHKECVSLARAGFEVHLIVPGEGTTEAGEVTTHFVAPPTGRFSRMTETTKAIFRQALAVDAAIYHFHDFELYRIALKLKRRGKKVIYDVHEHLPKTIEEKDYIAKPIRKSLSKLIGVLENKAARKMDYILTATEYIASRFSGMNPHIEVINNYPLKNELASSGRWEEKENTVCFVGGVTEQRGLTEVIEALDQLGNVKMHLAGGIYPAAFEERLKSSPGWKQVIYHGKVSREVVQQILTKNKAGLITLLPVANHIHAQPNKMFEYMSAGIPVIGSDFPLWRNIVYDNDCGYLVNPEDPRAVANAISRIMEDDDRARQMGENGRKAILEKYNWEQEEKKLIEIYKSIS